MNTPYPGDPQPAQWRQPVVDPSLPLNRQDQREPFNGGYPAPTVMTPQTQAPYPAPYPYAAPGQGDGFAITSLVLGIVSVSLGWIPICGIVSLAPAIIGIVLGSLGLRSARHRALSIAGIILSVLGVALAVVIVL